MKKTVILYSGGFMFIGAGLYLLMKSLEQESAASKLSKIGDRPIKNYRPMVVGLLGLLFIACGIGLIMQL